MSSAAERLYGGANAPAAPAALAGPTQAQRLYPEAEKPAARTDTDPAARLYAGTAFASQMPDGSVAGADMSAWREAAVSLEATDGEASEFHSLAAQFVHDPADDAQQAAWRDQAERLIEVNHYTAADLASARALLAKNAKMFAAVDRLGLGNHPGLIDKLVRQARREKLR